eukprot:CAMPEP_0196814062 /NCGR_PEP_ID=MMETSP1362-20130617/41085_1 /TAXON_ID=163516 /ORGANISM="Leptocylindrus danicus, Strain CCMP1856" /LENGTH=366 /DNA_ID=CAMNT_0042190567 /DNA_START=126 /DNA_END=1223 /DNA_ORIENTATION=+
MLIYHERQEALLCGQHALNNLVQSNTFDVSSLSEIAHQLDEVELAYMAQNDEGGTSSKEYLERVREGSGNVDPSGNFSIQVLRAALQNMYQLSLPNIRQQGAMDNVRDITDIEGFICNKQSHWFAIRKINGRYWNLNSTSSAPTQISHFRLAVEIESFQNDGYHVFFVHPEVALPAPCKSFEESEGRGMPQYWWKEEDLASGLSHDKSTTAATNHWRSTNVGAGMRLDGKPALSSANNGIINGGQSTSHMTEEEMLQMALAASMEQNFPEMKETETQEEQIQLTPEPSTSDAGTVRIQFRLPDGTRAIRRFYGKDPVGMVYAFVRDRCNTDKSFELRAGFPPKDISSQKPLTIEDANLNGESIQGR